MAKFKVGDRARVVADVTGKFPESIGREVIIIEALGPRTGGITGDFVGYRVDYIDGAPLTCSGGPIDLYRESELGPPHDQWAKDLIKSIFIPKPSILQQQTEEERTRVKKDKERVRSFLRSLG